MSGVTFDRNQGFNMDYLIVFFAGVVAGWFVSSAGLNSKNELDIQTAIDVEAWKRQAEGLNRKGDYLTETEPVTEGVGYDIKKRFKLAHNQNPTPEQLGSVKPPAPAKRVLHVVQRFKQ